MRPLYGLLLGIALASRAMGAPVYLQERLGPEPQSWVREFDLAVSADARGIAIAQAVKLDRGSITFEVLGPDGFRMEQGGGQVLTIGPAYIPVPNPGAYHLRVQANGAAGTWQFQMTAISPASEAKTHLIGGVLMLFVAATGVVCWRWMAAAKWRWLWLGAGLWVLGVALKMAFALAINPVVFGGLEKHLSHRWFVIVGSLYIGLLTGVFEVGIVALAGLLWRRMAADARQAVAIGVGAGAIEAALLGLGLAATMATLLAGTEYRIIAPSALMAAATPLAWLVSPVERILTILCHVSSRTLALLGVAQRRSWPFWMGFAMLTGVDVVAGSVHVSGQLGMFSLWWLELGLVPFALISVPLLRWAVRRWPSRPPKAEVRVSTVATPELLPH